MSRVKLPAKFAIPSSMATVLLMSACSGGGEKNNTQEIENKESSDYTLPFPNGETWYLTGGPHADGLSNGIRYAIDIAPPEVGKCPTDGSRLVIDNRIVTASASGQVIVAGDDKNRNDPSHSMIKIKDANGLTEVYIHAANIKVKKGDKVKQGSPLANPSCEYPPGGRNEGAHVHVGLEKDGQAIPIDGVVVGGWTIHNKPKNYDGTMTKSGEKIRTADTRRCDTDNVCERIRNDLTAEPTKAVFGASKSKTKEQVKSKSIDPTNPILTQQETQPEWQQFSSLANPYKIQYPKDWTVIPTEINGKQVDIFNGHIVLGYQTHATVMTEPINSWVTLETYVNNLKIQLKDFDAKTGYTTKTLGEELQLVDVQDKRYSQGLWEERKESPAFKTDVELSKISVDGQETILLATQIPEGAFLFNPEILELIAIFIQDGKAWTIRLDMIQAKQSYIKNEDDGISWNQESLSASQDFAKMLRSFKLLR